MDRNGGVGGRRTKEAMAQKGNIGIIQWVVGIHVHSSVCVPISVGSSTRKGGLLCSVMEKISIRTTCSDAPESSTAPALNSMYARVS